MIVEKFTAYAVWDLTNGTDAGTANTTITPAVTTKIPANAVVTGVLMLVDVPCAGSSSTYTVHVGTEAITAAVAVTALDADDDVYSTVLQKRIDAGGNIGLAMDSSNAATAGIVNIWVDYVMAVPERA
jgi:hypothetical protein